MKRLDNTNVEQKGIPDWLLKKEDHIVRKDKDTFVTKSILSVLKVLISE